MTRVVPLAIGATLATAVGLGVCAGADPSSQMVWRYVPSHEMRAVSRAIELSEERPEDLVEEVAYRGSARRYAQLRYGSENSRRVAIVVDDLGGGHYDFYADRNRDRHITANERLPGEGRERILDLAAEIIHETIIEQEPRQIHLRLSTLRDRLIVGTLGYIEGEVRLADSDASRSAPRKVRRFDGNANGLFTDAEDYIWIDQDGNGQWDPVAEQFACWPVLRLDGRRYAVHSDRFGRSLSLQEITGTGTLQLVIENLSTSARVTAFEATVFSADGSVFAVKQLAEKITVPVGKYTLGSLTITVEAGPGDPWHFVFSRTDSVTDADWVEVGNDAEVSLEAIGKLRFFLSIDEPRQVMPGGMIRVQPLLYTHNHLLINMSCRGKQIGSYLREQTHNRCAIQLVDAQGRVLESTSSGFA